MWVRSFPSGAYTSCWRVESANKLVVRFSTCKRPDGGEETIEMVGFDPTCGYGALWELADGNIADLNTRRSTSPIGKNAALLTWETWTFVADPRASWGTPAASALYYRAFRL